MTTKKTVSHSHVHSASVSPASEEAPAAAPSISTAGEVTAIAATAPAPGLIPASAKHPLVYLTPPPASTNIPAVPSNFVPGSGTTYRSVAPKKAELVALPLAVDDLRKFTTYDQVVGATAPPYEEILQTFDVTNQWSSNRTASSAWDVYSRDQEGLCWGVMRPSMVSLKAAFDLAATRDPSLPAKLPGLAAFLGVKTAIAVRAASTKRLNKKALAEGKPATHGQAGKERQKAADKAIVAAVNAQSAHTVVAPIAPAQAPAPVVVTPVAPLVAAPATPVVAAPATPVAPVAPVNGAPAMPVAPPPSAGVVNGANGAGH